MMHTVLRRLCDVLLAMGLSWIGSASIGQADSNAPVTLIGEPLQGAMMIGHAPSARAVWLDGQALPLAGEGQFVFGLAKAASEPQHLVVELNDGRMWEHRLTPTPRDFQIQRIDGLPNRMVTPPDDVMDRIQAEAQLARQARTIISDHTGFLESFIWPSEGRITGVYGSQRILNGEPRAPHWGIDIAAPTGTPVVAPASGRVVLVHEDMYFSGGTLFLDHGHGVMSSFLHLDSIEVALGDFLNQGDRLGTVGASGRATGPHLDWRMSWRDIRIDAGLLVPPR